MTSRGFSPGLYVKPRWGSSDAVIPFGSIFGPQRGSTSKPRVLPGEQRPPIKHTPHPERVAHHSPVGIAGISRIIGIPPTPTGWHITAR